MGELVFAVTRREIKYFRPQERPRIFTCLGPGGPMAAEGPGGGNAMGMALKS